MRHHPYVMPESAVQPYFPPCQRCDQHVFAAIHMPPPVWPQLLLACIVVFVLFFVVFS